ncbi:coiled-coil domain-containing protein 18-like [Schistocerca americana]|uniref:coiled-coil domain-containing protein 18-like n=1 Tax=Schistocerca americana TaxID=7009 RepID=UPI001F4F1FBD|nr:coiled-coil domain-containing protein 18-like [Schistocerca americana]
MAMQQQSESQQPSAVSEVSETLDASLTEVVPSGSINQPPQQSLSVLMSSEQDEINPLTVIMQQLTLLAKNVTDLTKAEIETKREMNEQLEANQVKVEQLAANQVKVQEQLLANQTKLNEQLEANQAKLNNKLVDSFQKLDDKLNKAAEELKIQNEKTDLKLAAQIEQVTQQCNEIARKLRLELTEYVATKLDTIKEQVESIPQIVQSQQQMQCSMVVILVLVEVQDELKQQVNEMSADMQDLRQSQDKIPKDIQNLDKSINNIKERQDEVDHKVKFLAGKFSELSLERQSISSDSIEHMVGAAIQSITESSEKNLVNKGLREAREQLGNELKQWKENIERSLKLSREDLRSTQGNEPITRSINEATLFNRSSTERDINAHDLEALDTEIVKNKSIPSLFGPASQFPNLVGDYKLQQLDTD